ncbi:MAG: GWxTD domain-containing protein [Candidatus Aminicenantaceae bacterium]
MIFFKFRCPALFLVLLLSIASLSSAQKVREKDLPEQYREWLKLTSYIILPQEKDVFMQLSSDRDRDIFIEAFWRQRDPTPGTPQNEYKEEHISRFIYANTKLKRGTPREGWMTDMGRIYIVLGPPNSIERFDSQAGIHSCQVWYYYGDQEKGLPTYFAIVFFQRGGSGEYKLYNPTSDGPISLLVDPKGIDAIDYRNAYNKIRELAPSLADVSISMIPGQLPYNYIPSPGNNIILSRIFESPKKDVAPSYATHFLNYKGVVSTEYLTNYIESVSEVALIIDPILNTSFLHFAVSPKRVSFDYFETKNQYYSNFQLNVSLRKEDNIIYQYSKDFPFYFSPNDTEKIRANGVSIQDSFPVIEGNYRVNILVQNSVGKEFCVIEKNISVPKDSGKAKIIGPILGFGSEEYISNLHVPFTVENRKLLVDPNNTFSATDDMTFFFNIAEITEELWREGTAEVFIKGLSDKNISEKSFSFDLKNYPYNKIICIFHSIDSPELRPDYYKMKVTLKNGRQEVIEEKNSEFILSPKETVPHPVTLSKSFPLSKSFLYFYSLAYQYDRVSELEKAEAAYKKAYSLNPGFKDGLVDYARFLLKTKKFKECLELVERVKGDEKLKFEYYLIKGNAYMGIGNYSDAIASLLEGNKIYNSDVNLLNSLGFCYYKTNQKEKALDVLKASLRLNPQQQEIEALIKKIE